MTERVLFARPTVEGEFVLRDGTADAAVVAEVWTEQVYVNNPEVLTGKRVLDLGANIGAFTVLAALADASVVAFEPDRSNFERLRYHLARNGVCDRVTAYQAAVLDRDGTAWLEGGGATAHVGRQGVQVPAVGIMSVVDASGPFHFVKMDIEGSEWPVLAEWAGTGMAGVHELVAEHHGPLMGDTQVDTEVVEHHLAAVASTLALLAEHGHLEVLGHLSVGGMIRWRSYHPPEGA